MVGASAVTLNAEMTTHKVRSSKLCLQLAKVANIPYDDFVHYCGVCPSEFNMCVRKGSILCRHHALVCADDVSKVTLTLQHLNDDVSESAPSSRAGRGIMDLMADADELRRELDERSNFTAPDIIASNLFPSFGLGGSSMELEIPDDAERIDYDNDGMMEYYRAARDVQEKLEQVGDVVKTRVNTASREEIEEVQKQCEIDLQLAANVLNNDALLSGPSGDGSTLRETQLRELEMLAEHLELAEIRLTDPDSLHVVRTKATRPGFQQLRHFGVG